MRPARERGALIALLIVMASTGPLPWASAAETLETQLYRRFQPSRIEIRDPAHRGIIVRQGKLLTVVGGAVPAKPFHVMQPNPSAPAIHAMDFARVDVKLDGSVHVVEPGSFVIPRGSRVVVLDVKLSGSRVHLLTHTAEPLPTGEPGPSAYGCTEFTFEVPATVLAGGDAEQLIQLIERSLEWSPQERFCAPGHSELCIEP